MTVALHLVGMTPRTGWQGTWEVHEPVEKMFVLVRE